MRYLSGCCAIEAVVGLLATAAGLVLGWSVLRW